MSLKLIKCLLNKEFYDKYRHKISEDFFVHDNNIKGLFKTLVKAYDTIQADLTVDSLKELHYTYNPTITLSNKKVLEGVFTDLSNLDLTKEVSEVVLKQAIEQQLWTELANVSIQGGDGLQTDILRAQEILDNIREGITLGSDNVKEVSDDLDELLKESQDKFKWGFVLKSLRRRIPGIGPNTFTLIPARTNVGKTGLVTALIFQPPELTNEVGGFIHQGAKTLYVGNEESVARTKVRAYSCLSGIKESELREDDEKRQYAKELYNKVKHNMRFIDAVGYSMEELTCFLKDNKGFDILVVDILDKLSLGGKTDNEAERLYKLYTSYRELGKRFDLAVIGTCQASVDAENRDVFGTDALANSKTGKGGELDLCLCLGRRIGDDGVDTSFRTINIAKNKLNSQDGAVTFHMDKDTCRLTA